jgi:hypothetical protein
MRNRILHFLLLVVVVVVVVGGGGGVEIKWNVMSWVFL